MFEKHQYSYIGAFKSHTLILFYLQKDVLRYWNTINPKNTSSIKTDQLLLQSILKIYKYIGPMVINNISICVSFYSNTSKYENTNKIPTWEDNPYYNTSLVLKYSF